MNSDMFDTLARSLAKSSSRRGALRGFATALGIGWTATLDPGGAVAKNKKHKKPKKNEFGCLNIGKACNGKNSKCCSGICKGKRPKKGKKDKSKCVAHNALTCQDGEDACLSDVFVCGTGGASSCFRTTGKASFCGGSGGCADCRKDTDCEFLAGEGAACVVCATCAEGTACYVRSS